jgi:2-polyprenyl-3-methyl-5-hydroxy-6-metoxy-1,4-benzoquinol methylase
MRSAVGRRVQQFAPGRQFRLELARRTIESFAGGRALHVLDAGCEEGQLANTLAKRNPTWRVRGVDVNEDALANARASADAAGIDNVGYAQVDITRPFASEEFDAIAAVECLAEIPADQDTVSSLTRALRPEGLLVLHVPEASWRPVLPHSPAEWPRETRHGYSADDLEQLLQCAGLHQIQLTPTTRAVVHAAEEIRFRTRRRRLRVRGLLYPLLWSAVRLERMGVTAGSARGLFVTARRPGA